MIIRRTAKDTLTPVEAFHGDTIVFTRLDGSTTEIELLRTGAEVVRTTLKHILVEEPGAFTIYRFWADVKINGTETRLEREVGTQKSFYEPWEIDGVRIWLDVVNDIFTFVRETHGPCRTRKACARKLPEYRHARFALQDATARICPESLHPWCPLPEGGLRIEECFRGEDCWLGAFDGGSAHGGLDINHPKGTPLYAPIDFDTHFFIRHVKDGARNNSWRGFRRWANGSEWILLSAHMTELTVPEHTPLKAGTHYAVGAGVLCELVEHSHFTFTINELGDRYVLDPWILFWQMYRDKDD